MTTAHLSLAEQNSYDPRLLLGILMGLATGGAGLVYASALTGPPMMAISLPVIVAAIVMPLTANEPLRRDARPRPYIVASAAIFAAALLAAMILSPLATGSALALAGVVFVVGSALAFLAYRSAQSTR